MGFFFGVEGHEQCVIFQYFEASNFIGRDEGKLLLPAGLQQGQDSGKTVCEVFEGQQINIIDEAAELGCFSDVLELHCGSQERVPAEDELAFVI